MLRALKAMLLMKMKHVIAAFYCTTVPLPSGRQDHVKECSKGVAISAEFGSRVIRGVVQLLNQLNRVIKK